jgi:asparagine synthase (glutamine-hydrolysing)
MCHDLRVCGIAGILRLSGRDDADRDLTARMLARLERRGPDGYGLVEDGLLVLGHRRLAILDLNDRANQPMRSPCGRFLLSFNGEIYNFRQLREEMGLRAADMRTTSDTEILLHAWARWGEAALSRMAGQWAFALFDSVEGTLFLVRDRFGEKPLFYHAGSQAIAFASSIGALLQVPWVPRNLDPDSIAEYLTLRYTIAPRTVVREVKKVPPGHLLAIQHGEIVERTWYDGAFGARAPGRRSRRRMEEEFGSLLAQASERCLTSDVPAGILLSDGIDSHAIRASVRTFDSAARTFTFEPVGRNEAPVMAGDAMRRFSFGVDERVSAIVPAFSSLTEPVGDGAALATWMLIRAAREHAVVFLCGHGADEVLGGYRLSQARFRLAVMRQLAWLPGEPFERLVLRHTSGTESAAGRRRRLLASNSATLPGAARYVINRPLSSEDLGAILKGPAPSGRWAPGREESGYLAGIDRLYTAQPPQAGDLDRMQNVMIRTFLSENILTYADSMAMDASAEIRLPYLDRDLVEFVFSLPRSARVGFWPGRTNTKLLLRRWGRRRLDPEILRRRKHTFQSGSLRRMFEKHGATMRSFVLDVPALRNTLPGLERWMRQGEEDLLRGPRGGTLWALLALGIWCDRNGIAQADSAACGSVIRTAFRLDCQS